MPIPIAPPFQRSAQHQGSTGSKALVPLKAAPAVYQPILSREAIQTKTAFPGKFSNRVNSLAKLSPSPQAYNPTPAREAIQTKGMFFPGSPTLRPIPSVPTPGNFAPAPAGGQKPGGALAQVSRRAIAPPVYRPTVQASRPAVHKPSTKSLQGILPLRSTVLQLAQSGREDYAVHNWDEVVAQYNNRSAGREVEDAFARAGYAGGQIRQEILRAMRTIENGKWRWKKIAHGLGDQQSGKRSGTDKNIQKVKGLLIKWAQEHPPSGASGGGGGGGGGIRSRAKKESVEELGYDRVEVLISQLARWAKDDASDEVSREKLKQLSQKGYATATKKLIELGIIKPDEPALAPLTPPSPLAATPLPPIHPFGPAAPVRLPVFASITAQPGPMVGPPEAPVLNEAYGRHLLGAELYDMINRPEEY